MHDPRSFQMFRSAWSSSTPWHPSSGVFQFNHSCGYWDSYWWRYFVLGWVCKDKTHLQIHTENVPKGT